MNNHHYQIILSKTFKTTFGATRTRNLRLRRPTPYPLGHEGTSFIWLKNLEVQRPCYMYVNQKRASQNRFSQQISFLSSMNLFYYFYSLTLNFKLSKKLFTMWFKIGSLRSPFFRCRKFFKLGTLISRSQNK